MFETEIGNAGIKAIYGQSATDPTTIFDGHYYPSTKTFTFFPPKVAASLDHLARPFHVAVFRLKDIKTDIHGKAI